MITGDLDKWDHRFLQMAKLYSSWSKDPSTQIGAVIVDPITRRVLSGGYNGFPRNIEDSYERLFTKEIKYRYVVHGEMNAIYNATASGVPLNGATIYVSGLPSCSECAKGIIQVGITRVVCEVPKNIPEKWAEHWEFSKSMYDEAGVETKLYNMH